MEMPPFPLERGPWGHVEPSDVPTGKAAAILWLMAHGGHFCLQLRHLTVFAVCHPELTAKFPNNPIKGHCQGLEDRAVIWGMPARDLCSSHLIINLAQGFLCVRAVLRELPQPEYTTEAAWGLGLLQKCTTEANSTDFSLTPLCETILQLEKLKIRGGKVWFWKFCGF